MKITQKDKVKFVSCSSDTPLIKFELKDNITGIAVVDTGSDTSVFDKDFIKANKADFKIKVTKDMMDAIGISGSNMLPIVEASTNINVGGTFYEVNAVMMPLNHLTEHFKSKGFDIPIAAILGSEFLNNAKAKIDFKQKVISFNGISCK